MFDFLPIPTFIFLILLTPSKGSARSSVLCTGYESHIYFKRKTTRIKRLINRSQGYSIWIRSNDVLNSSTSWLITISPNISDSLLFIYLFNMKWWQQVPLSMSMNWFGRCQIGSEVFGLVISSWHIKSSYVVAK